MSLAAHMAQRKAMVAWRWWTGLLGGRRLLTRRSDTPAMASRLVVEPGLG
jgi:hypothetical protein